MTSRRPASILLVLVTCPNQAVARRLGTALVSRRLAACVNVVGSVESVFRWKGRVDRCRESLLLIKTTARGFTPLKRAILRLHPYTLPEVIGIPLSAGHQPYLQWVAQSCASRRSGRAKMR